MDDPPLASLSLTHVHYDPNDPVSYVCAYLALIPQALCITYVTLIWSTREAEVLMMFAGQMGCEAVNWVLKRWIREERPMRMNGKGYGMPSSHAQFVAFFAVSLTLFLLARHNPHAPNASKTHIPTKFWERLLLSLLVAGVCAAVAQSRIYLNYHTPKQVMVGCCAGAVIAVGWFVVTSYMRYSGWLEWILELPPVRYFRIRDLVVHEDLVAPIESDFEIQKVMLTWTSPKKLVLSVLYNC
ncbi:DOLPP1 protein [Myriangium duriaei CBS 260.36]|uniref:Dolichyldiphosphatase n=1 Tax=Myriangium duriaei CBS 260.36 TaxID=1168546 RepID=A0A9P4JAS6_9PEZI|nr:DOLPP1 protein [Myriangium duriaei CBS 260.36]